MKLLIGTNSDNEDNEEEDEEETQTSVRGRPDKKKGTNEKSDNENPLIEENQKKTIYF